MYIFGRDNIAIDLKANTKQEVLKELFTYFDRSQIDNIEECFDAILCREAIASTGIGRRIAIPHAKTRSAKETQIAFGISKKGIDFNSIDFYDVKFIFMIVSPMKSDIYLELISKITKFMRDVEFQKTLLNCKFELDILNMLKGKLS